MSLIDRIAQRLGFVRKPTAASQRAFAGAQLGRLTDSWRAQLRAINEELRGDQDRLIARARELETNNDYAKRYLGLVERNVVGPRGFRLLPKAEEAGVADKLANQAISKAWADWCRSGVCEVTGQQDFAELCRMLMRGKARDGEFLVREILGTDARNAYGYALQALDVGRIATWLSRIGGPNENPITMGVEHDAFFRPIAYHFTRQVGTNRTTDRVPADAILHKFRLMRAEQVRGVTSLHAAMLTMHYVGEFSISALLNAKAGSDRLGFFVSPDGQPPSLGQEGDPEGIATSAPGTWDTLPHGYDVRQLSNPYPNDVFGPFVKVGNQRIASGLDVSYPSLANDYEAVNFSSIRAAVLEERDMWRTEQGWFIAVFLSRVYRNWLKFALANKAIVMPNGSALPLAKLTKFEAHQWRARGWAWVDPKNDAQAAQTRLQEKLTTRTRLLADEGEDIDETFAELSEEEKLAEAYGITFNPDGTPVPASTDTGAKQ